ncbi:hypothetical protein K7711_42270 [Nocardia sp. CA2R105]|uniref:hypothetical protein n=1 Tax=Nocardia coffeae TaxID=2873381 RepID=UPI001CA76D3C|nr:hypothetical protein [Nocardia coffeae]MBY8863155.1 hypothetical protein [Nocardia coffeae]
MADTDDTPFTEAEHRELLRLLRRWCDTELDQSANLIVPTRLGDVYVSVGRHPVVDDLPAELFSRAPDAWFDRNDQ